MNKELYAIQMANGYKNGEPSEVVDAAISIYREAGEEIDALKKVQDEMKRHISDTIAATGLDRWSVSAGICYVSAPSVSVSYDAKALDALAASDDNLARILAPHRKVSERGGSLTIRANK